MTCDEERPCTRCVKRNIGHLCHDESKSTVAMKADEIFSSSDGAMDVSNFVNSEDTKMSLPQISGPGATASPSIPNVFSESAERGMLPPDSKLYFSPWSLT